MSSAVPLYWFQQEAENRAIVAWHKENKNSILISAPTGAGKTIIFSDILREVLSTTKDRGMILVHRDSLLEQAVTKLKFVWPDVEIGRVKSKIREYDKQITVASVQTLAGHIDELIEACNKYGPIKYAIFDEAHHSYAPSWFAIFKALREQLNAKCLGVTATPLRTKKDENLSKIFEEAVYSISIFSLIDEGFLSPVFGHSVKTSLSLKGIRITKGDYNVQDLDGKMENSNFNREVVHVWKRDAQGRKSMCFAVSIKHIERLVDEFNKAGAAAVGIHGKLPLEEQRQIQRDFTDGKHNVLVTCMLLTEGYDEPSVDCILMTRPTTSRTLYVQMLGRGLRTHPGKQNCLLFDFVANAADNSLVTMQDLLGFYGLQQAEKVFKDHKVKNLEISPRSIPHLRAADTFGPEMSTAPACSEIDVFDINKFAWTELAGNKFVTVRQSVSIAVIKEKDQYVPYLVFTGAGERSVAKISEPVEENFAEAIANVYLFDYGNRHLVTKEQNWRKDEPSPDQIAALQKAIDRYKTWHPGSTVDIDNVPYTKGAYSDMLTAIYAIGYINSPKIPRINRESALERLKYIVLREKKAIAGPADNGKRLDAGSIQPSLSGTYTKSDLNSIIDIIINLQDDKNGKYPVKFLMENPIVFENGAIKVSPKRPLTDKQYGFLVDKIQP